jgi:hypothetical protein
MKRLIAAGCSLTYGHGLPDCVDKNNKKHPGPNPSKMAWPSLIADKLNRSCINLSCPGASNKQIWHTLLNFNFEPDDIVIVYWSFIHRYCFLTDKMSEFLNFKSNVNSESMFDINNNQQKNNFYYKNLFTEYDSILDFYLRVRDADTYLLSQNVEKIIHLTIEDPTESSTWYRNTKPDPAPIVNKSFSQSPKFAKINSIADKNTIWVDMALDNDHPGVLSHQLFANQLFNLKLLS